MRQYRFGDHAMDVARRRLLKDGEPVVIGPRLFDTLPFFVDRAGNCSTRTR